MAKRQQFSPFDALKQARTSEQPAVQTVSQSDSQTAGQLAKSKDGEFLKFTTYVRKRTHRAVKARLVEEGRELSDLVEELLGKWLEGHRRPLV
jgi:hypothetical protein